MLIHRCKYFIKKNIKKILSVFLCIFISMVGITCYLYFNAEHIQSKIKENVCNSVLKHEDELFKIVEECEDNEIDYLSFREMQGDSSFTYYKEQNNKTINKMFQKFHLFYVDNCDDNFVNFSVRPTIVTALLWDNYWYGFYYVKDNKAFDVFRGKEYDGEIEGTTTAFGKYWYRTEQIDEYWWFYECKIKFWPVKR